MPVSISTDDLLEIIARLPKKREHWQNHHQVTVLEHPPAFPKLNELPKATAVAKTLTFIWNERRQCWELQL